MSIEKLKRTLWRARRINSHRITNEELRICIMREIGTSKECYAANRQALIKLGWIKPYKNKHIDLTNADLEQ